MVSFLRILEFRTDSMEIKIFLLDQGWFHFYFILFYLFSSPGTRPASGVNNVARLWILRTKMHTKEKFIAKVSYII